MGRNKPRRNNAPGGHRRGGGGSRGGGHGRDDRDRNGRSTRPYQLFNEIPKENERMEQYYNNLLQLPQEEQAEFWAALRRELPNSFRFCGSKGHALTVKRLLQTRYIPEITKITNADGQYVDPPQVVPWYPDSLAWWMTTPKNVIRKFPPFAAFQKFLVSETSVGNISRQEVVSMIPPLFIDLRPGMTCLDLCAAPGSKSAQLLEMLHRGEEARIRQWIKLFGGGDGTVKTEHEPEVKEEQEGEDDEFGTLSCYGADDGRATGMLIANDSDYRRCHMLIHQLKRLSSPNFMVTNHDATMFPPLRVPNSENPGRPEYLKFDRVLADVPCSGDGTLRKNCAIWKDWAPMNGLGLHLTQVRILVRALQMLKPGGRVVYSTCSMNPVENEAVVAAAVDRCGGQDVVEIVDCSQQLPLLKRKPGLKKWQVMDKFGRLWSSWEELQVHIKSTEGGVIPSKVVDTMFPAAEGTQSADIPLERCMRVYAHQQDTGAFFITVLQKRREFKAKPEDSRKVQPVSGGALNGNVGNGAPTNGSPKHSRDESEDEVPPIKRLKAKQDPEPTEPSAQHASEQSKDGEEQVVVTKAVASTESPTVISSEAPTPQPLQASSAVQARKHQQQQEQKQQSGNKRKTDGPYEEPFKFLAPDHDVIKDVTAFYGISARFPQDRFLVRNALGEPAKAIYYTSALIRDLLVLNEGRAVKFVHGGVKMFVKQDAPSANVCRWRIQSEGMPLLHGYIGHERVVVLRKKETLRQLLVEMFPKISDGGWERLDEVGERVRDMGMGCCVLRVEPRKGVEGEADEDFAEHMALPLWKSFQSLNLMLPKEDRSAMLLRVFNDATPLVNTGLHKDRKEGEGQGEGTVKADEEAVAEDADGKVEEGADKVEEEAVKVDKDAKIKTEDGVAVGPMSAAADGDVNMEEDLSTVGKTEEDAERKTVEAKEGGGAS